MINTPEDIMVKAATITGSGENKVAATPVIDKPTATITAFVLPKRLIKRADSGVITIPIKYILKILAKLPLLSR